ncbi:MAG: polysaccharide biosynthesis/export family protein [Pirellulales bacterium]
MDQRHKSKSAERTGHRYRLGILLATCCFGALAVVVHVSLAQDPPSGVTADSKDPAVADTYPGEWLTVAQPPVAAEPLGGQITLGVDSQAACAGEADWDQFGPIGFDQYGPGEFAGPARLPVMSEYRLRIDDTVLFVFRLTRERTTKAYRLNVGDKLLIDSVNNKDINREVQIQPDGSVVLFLLGTVPAAGRTVDEFRGEIQKLYAEYYRDDIISVAPKQIDTRLQDLLAAVDNRQGNQGGQSLNGRVTPAGTLQLPGVGSVLAQGLTLDELATEINLRYSQITPGLDVTPILTARATPLAYVLGEVRQPSQISLQRPTTVMQAIALAGGWGIGGNLREIVVFRRADDWRLIATRIDLRGALLGKRPCPADEIWLRDSDVVLVPKTPLKRTTDLVESVFADGVNHLILFGAAAGVLELSTIQ